MSKVNCIHIMFGCILKCKTVVTRTIAIIRRLLRTHVCVLDLIRVEVLISSELWWILILKGFFNSTCLIIGYILATSLPANLCSVCIFHWIYKRPHSFLVSRIWLHKVNKMYSICLIFSGVHYSEIVPLTIALCAVIIFDIALILMRANFHNLS